MRARSIPVQTPHVGRWHSPLTWLATAVVCTAVEEIAETLTVR